MDLSLKKSIPWLVLAGSGGLADLVSDILTNVSAAPSLPGVGSEGDGEAATKTDLRGRVTERLLKHFPSEQDTDKLVDKVMNKNGLMCIVKTLQHDNCTITLFVMISASICKEDMSLNNTHTAGVYIDFKFF